jgi:hypothetical protein
MSIFKHQKHIQKEFDRIERKLKSNTPLKKPTSNKKLYSGKFTDNEGKSVEIKNGQIVKVV